METKKLETFVKEMEKSLNRLKPEGTSITFKRVAKNNRQGLHAVILEVQDFAAAPTFYLEDLFPAYGNGVSAEKLAKSLLDFALKNKEVPFDQNFDIEDYGTAKERFGLCVLGIERNKEYLSDKVYERHEDLALIPVIFTENGKTIGHIKVRKAFLESWGVTGEEVLREAKENSPKLLPLTFKQLGDDNMDSIAGPGPELFVISNTYYAGGAAVAFYPRVLECLAMTLGRDLYVLPSSVNEMIVVTDVGQDPNILLSIVKEVNRTQLAPEDVLTDAVYYYDRKTDQFRKILPIHAA